MVIEIHNLSFTASLLISYSTVTEYMQEWKKTAQVPGSVPGSAQRRKKKLSHILGCFFKSRVVRDSAHSWNRAWELILSIHHI